MSERKNHSLAYLKTRVSVDGGVATLNTTANTHVNSAALAAAS